MSNKENICKYCGENPPIKNSHIASKFLLRHVKKRFPGGLRRADSNKKQQDGLKGPCFCKCCEGKFCVQEDYFRRKVFEKIIANIENSKSKNIEKLSDKESIKFILSTSFRYTIYLLEEVSYNKTTEIFKNLTFRAIEDISLVGKEIFIYPWIFQPIIKNCYLKGKINHLLNAKTTAASCNGSLNIFLLILPAMIFLLSDSNLEENYQKIDTHITKDKSCNWLKSNTNLPARFCEKINEQTRCHTFQMEKEKTANPKFQQTLEKAFKDFPLFAQCYEWDKELSDWQKKNCR